MQALLIIVLSILAPLFINAQTTTTWKGGTPGRETTWNEPKNWDANRIPGEWDKVIIKREYNGHFSQPVINAAVQVSWLEIHPGAELTITPSGQLTIDGSFTYSEGVSIYGGNIRSDGEIVFKDIDSEFIAKLDPVCLNQKTTYYSEIHGYEFCVVSSSIPK
jgi:hypothetical protein